MKIYLLALLGSLASAGTYEDSAFDKLMTGCLQSQYLQVGADGGVACSTNIPAASIANGNLGAGVIAAGIADGAITTDKLGGGAVTTPKIANGAVTAVKVADGLGLSQIDEAVFQRRVSAICAADSSIRIIADDGQVTCEGDDAGAGEINTYTSSKTFTSTVQAASFLGVGVSSTVIKTSTESVSNSAALQNDDHLAVGIAANTSWAVYGYFCAFSTSATPDIKIAFTFPAGATTNIGFVGNNGTLASALTGTLFLTGQSSGLLPLGVVIDNPIFFSGVIVNGGTAGNLQLQWAQNTANGALTYIRPNGYLVATRLK